MKLTKRQREILEYMLHPPDGEDGELVCEKGQWWFGLERTTWKVVKPLLQHTLIRLESDSDVGKFERYTIRLEAENVLADPTYETMMERHLRTGEPVHE